MTGNRTKADTFARAIYRRARDQVAMSTSYDVGAGLERLATWIAQAEPDPADPRAISQVPGDGQGARQLACAPDVAAAFAELAETLAGDLDIDAYLTAVCRHCVGLTGAACAAIVYAEEPSARAARVGSSGTPGRQLAEGALAAGTGPWRESMTQGQLITVADLRSDASRWPMFAAEALRAGVTAVTVIPVTPRGGVTGALALLGDAALDATGIHLACSLAEAAGAGIVLADELRRRETAIARLQTAMASRILVEQSKPTHDERSDVAAAEAYDWLRWHARKTQRRRSARSWRRAWVWCVAASAVVTVVTAVLSALDVVSVQEAIAVALPAEMTALIGVINVMVPDACTAWRRGFRHGYEASPAQQARRFGQHDDHRFADR